MHARAQTRPGNAGERNKEIAGAAITMGSGAGGGRPGDEIVGRLNRFDFHPRDRLISGYRMLQSYRCRYWMW